MKKSLPVLLCNLADADSEKGWENSIVYGTACFGVIDHSDAEITLDMQNPGSLFAGFGGNFRLQNPAADPKVIDYCLENLR